MRPQRARFSFRVVEHAAGKKGKTCKHAPVARLIDRSIRWQVSGYECSDYRGKDYPARSAP
jgi:hypothetical protein